MLLARAERSECMCVHTHTHTHVLVMEARPLVFQNYPSLRDVRWVPCSPMIMQCALYGRYRSLSARDAVRVTCYFVVHTQTSTLLSWCAYVATMIHGCTRRVEALGSRQRDRLFELAFFTGRGRIDWPTLVQRRARAAAMLCFEYCSFEKRATMRELFFSGC